MTDLPAKVILHPSDDPAPDCRAPRDTGPAADQAGPTPPTDTRSSHSGQPCNARELVKAVAARVPAVARAQQNAGTSRVGRLRTPKATAKRIIREAVQAIRWARRRRGIELDANVEVHVAAELWRRMGW